MFAIFATAIFMVLIVSCLLYGKLGLAYVNSVLVYRKSKCLNKGPRAYPLIGIPSLIGIRSHDLLDAMICFCKMHASPFPIWSGPYLQYMVHDAEQIKEVLNNPHAMSKSELYNYFRPLFGNSLLTVQGPRWSYIRQYFQQSFVMKQQSHWIDVVNKYSQELVEEWKGEINGGEFSVNDYAPSCMLGIIMEYMFDVKLGSGSLTGKQFYRLIHRLKIYSMAQLMAPWQFPDYLYRYFPLEGEHTELISSLRNYAREIIAEARRKYTDESNIDQFYAADEEIPYLHRLIRENTENEVKMGEMDMVAECLITMIAGTDTTSFALSFILLMLAYFPEKQEKAYKELYNIYGSKDTTSMPITPADLKDLKYLECVIIETLRIFPPVPVIGRFLKEDVKIGNSTIPKGANLMIPIMALHRSKQQWKDPLNYEPERHLTEPQYDFLLPFSRGSRNCPAKAFGMMQLKIIVGTILRNYVLKSENVVPLEDIKIDFALLADSYKPVAIRIENRLGPN